MTVARAMPRRRRRGLSGYLPVRRVRRRSHRVIGKVVCKTAVCSHIGYCRGCGWRRRQARLVFASRILPASRNGGEPAPRPDSLTSRNFGRNTAGAVVISSQERPTSTPELDFDDLGRFPEDDVVAGLPSRTLFR